MKNFLFMLMFVYLVVGQDFSQGLPPALAQDLKVAMRKRIYEAAMEGRGYLRVDESQYALALLVITEESNSCLEHTSCDRYGFASPAGILDVCWKLGIECMKK